ncbi:MAG TPA: SgcJ/EcaC family oxidoreductase [Gemmatimonadales bacterium]|nr:SgcJ/EcaC family oxidoreductase [Gemmatimonadales bacterium]
MDGDQHAIREVLALWHRATAAGDVDTVLKLMAEDVVFLVAGHPPMRGRAAFEQGLRTLLAQHQIESTGEIQEVEVSGNLAYAWSMLTVRIVPLAGGNATIRTGNALSILRKQADGSWVVVRDANLLSAAQ